MFTSLTLSTGQDLTTPNWPIGPRACATLRGPRAGSSGPSGLNSWKAVHADVQRQENLNVDVVAAADFVASAAHKDQVRKYTGAPYIVHPRRVGVSISMHHPYPGTVAAALLHDVLEDSQVSKRTIHEMFGDEVFKWVLETTNVSTKGERNRAQRKAIDFSHFAKASPIGQSIKVADRIDNISMANAGESIVHHNPEFAVTYLRETKELFQLLTLAKRELLDRAWVEFHLAVRELESITGKRFVLA